MAQSWFDQVRHSYESKEYRRRKSSTGVSIYRVPESIKKTKPEAYDPLTVFLGPFQHKRQQQLTAVDEYKLQAVDRTLERIPRMTIRDLVAKVGELEGRIRDCYEDSAIECDGDMLAWIMTMDACFILEFLRMDLPDSSLVFQSERHGNIRRREIILDILKLENQIPLFILKTILQLEFNDFGEVRTCLADWLVLSMGVYFRGYPFKVEEDVGKNRAQIAQHIDCALHLLGLSRQVIADFLSQPDVPGGPPLSAIDKSLIPSAEKLRRAGISLKASTDGKVYFRHSFFRRSTLSIPRIIVEDYTEIFLRNLVAFEECQRQNNSPIKRIISRNMHMMDYLIDSNEDVQLFQKAEIIRNHLGTNDEVARVFNGMCIGISYKDDLENVLRDVNEHYNSRLNVLMTDLKQQYCSKPWYFLSFMAASALLVMTLLQTIYAMKSYFHSL